MFLGRIFRFVLLLALLGTFASHILDRPLPSLKSFSTTRAEGVFHMKTPENNKGEPDLKSLSVDAKKEELDFVILSDLHRQLDAPLVRDRLAILSYAELRTTVGDIIALGSPDLVGPDARHNHKVLQDLEAQGAFSVALHLNDPDRPFKAPLHQASALEISSPANTARQLSTPSFVAPLLLGPLAKLRPELALTFLMRHDHHTLNRWDTKQNGAMPGLCANELPDLMHLPTLSTLQASRLVLTDELPKDSMHRAEAIVDSISSGHFYCTHAVFGGTPEFSFRAIHKDIETGRAGDKLSFDEVSSFEILGPEFESARVFSVLYRNGEEVSRALNSPLIYQDPLPGIYRVEILVEVPNLFWGHRLAPLVYSNQITVLPVRSAQLQ